MSNNKSKFISDLHLGHSTIHKFRTEFESAEQHDNFVIDSIIQNTGKRTSLWILGDICFTEDSLLKFEKVLDHVGWCKIIIGNHERDSAERRRTCDKLINMVDGYYSLFPLNKKYWLSHAPIHPQELRGKINIQGHCHSKSLDDDRYVNVSCEAIDYIPRTLEELMIRRK